MSGCHLMCACARSYAYTLRQFDKAVKIELYCQDITSFIISLTLLVMCALWNLKDVLYHIMVFSIT